MTEKKPPAMNIFIETAEQLLNLEAVELGNVMQAAIKYYLNDEMPENLSKLEDFAFASVKSGLDRSVKKYSEDCAKKQDAANQRWKKERKLKEAAVLPDVLKD